MVDSMRPQRFSLILLALAVSAVVLASCASQGGTPSDGGAPEIGSVSVMGVWGGTELSSFQKVVEGWTKETGGQMKFEGTRDLSAILRARLAGGDPPDIAILPNPALLRTFGSQGKLQPLDGVLDMAQLKKDYAQDWIDQGSVDGKLYGLFVRASTKNTVWYAPKQFKADGFATPTTWDELTALETAIRGKGNTAPWSVGMEAGGASGWPGSDWIQQIVLAESGPDVYDKWVAHEIPWTDPAIKSAFQKFGEIVLTDGNVSGGSQAILSTNFQDSTYLPYDSPPRAYMCFLGAFTQGFIAAQYPRLKPVEDYDFFPFPTINPQYQGAQTVGGDVVVMMRDTPSARSLMQYMAKGDSWESWAKSGGFATPNKSLNTSAYPDPLGAKAAQQLTAAGVVRYDADDTMPAVVQNAEWKAVLDYIQRPGDLDKILSGLEATAKDAYAQQQ
jgi:alpha-glucoside transport system substrate-binding protein